LVSFERTVTINRPRDLVFDFVSDPANDARWRKGSRCAEWTSPGPVGVGSTMRSVDRVMGREIEGTSEITAWDPPRMYAFRSLGSSFPAEFRLKFAPLDGRTRLTMVGRIEFRGILKLFEWLFGGQVRRQVEDDLETLRRLLESE
jgi:carbon monoxide dehydrogenase subunit G